MTCADHPNRALVSATHRLACTRGGTRKLPTEELELPTRGLKWLKHAVFVHHVAKNFLRKEPEISSDRGPRCLRQGGCSPSLALPWRHHWFVHVFGSQRRLLNALGLATFLLRIINDFRKVQPACSLSFLKSEYIRQSYKFMLLKYQSYLSLQAANNIT